MKKLIFLIGIVTISNFSIAQWTSMGALGSISTGNGGEPDMAINPVSGEVYVSHKNNGVSGQAGVKKWDGTTWTPVGLDNFTASSVSYNNISFNSLGEPHVVFMDGANGNRASVMKFDGTNWNYLGTPGFSVGAAAYCDIEFNSSDEPVVVYRDASLSNSTQVKSYNGATWVNVGSASPMGAQLCSYTEIAIDAADNYYVAMSYGGGQTNRVYVWDGLTWTFLGAGMPADNAYYQDIEVNSAGIPYVSYVNYSGARPVKTFMYSGGTWSSVGSATGWTAGSSYYPTLKFDSFDNPYCVYYDGAAANRSTVRMWDGLAWNLIGTQGFSGGNADNTRMVITSSDQPIVCFQDGTQGGAISAYSFGAPPVTPHALDFDGVNDYISIPDNNVIDLTSTFTLESWVYVDALPASRAPFISKWDDDANNRGYYFALKNDGNFQVYLDETGTCSNCPAWNPGVGMPTGVWTHVALTHDSSLPTDNDKIFVNGVQVAQRNWPFDVNVNSADLYLAGYDGPGNGLNAGANLDLGDYKMDEVRIFSCAKSAGDILADMSADYVGNESNLVAYYDFGDGAGTSLSDLTATANNGTLVNGPVWVGGVTTSGAPSFTGCPEPEIDITGNAVSIADGDVTPDISDDTDFGAPFCAETRTFTISNSGAATLNLTGGPTFVTLSGSAAFTVSTQPTSGTIAPAGSETFEITYTPTGAVETATVTITSDDADEGTYTFDITGNGALIADQTVNTASFSIICSADTTIELASSQVGIDYYLRNDADNSVIDGPVTGIGGVINLSTGNINSTATYNIWGKGSGSNDDGALDFDGIDDQVIIANNASLDLSTNEFTIEYWANPSVVDGNFHWVAGKENNNSDLDYLTGLNSSNQWRFIARNLSIDIIAGPVVTAGTWYHVACVFDGATASLYVNGILVGTDNTVGSGVTSTATLKLGARNGGQNFAGTIDDVRLWNSAKSDQDINVYMDECLTGTEPNLVAFYNMSDGTGSSTLTDQSLNTNNGALTSMDSATDWVVGKSCNSCSQEMSSLVTITIDPIVDQTISQADFNMICSADTIATISSQTGVDYYLRDDADDSVIDGPIAGTGGVINLSTGTVTSTTTYNVYAAKISTSGALDFDGSAEYVLTATNTGIENINDAGMTIEFWAKPEVYGGTKSMIRKTGDYDIYFQGSTLRAEIYFDGTANKTTVDGPNTIPTGVWSHIALVWDGSVATWYVNGVSSPAVVVGPGSTGGSSNLGIGGSQIYAQHFDGEMDEVRIWTEVRSLADINNNMNVSLTGSETNLAGYWDFEDGTGSSVAVDKSANGNNGNLSAMEVGTDWVVRSTVGCSLEMTDMLTITIDPIADQTLNEADWASCDTQADSLLTLNGSQTGVNYYLRDDADDSVIDGPIAGSGGAINFNTGAVASTTTYNVNAVVGDNSISGLNFDGTNDYVLVGNPASLQLSQGTYECWIKTTNAGTGHRGIMGKQTATHLFLFNNELIAYDWTGPGNIGTGIFPNDGNWHHVALVFDNGVANGSKIYYDGVPVTTFTYNIQSQGEGFTMGAGADTGSQNFAGDMDGHAVYNYIKNDAEILAAFNSCPSSSDANLAGFWSHEDGTGSSVSTDLSTNGNNGALVNMDPSTDWVTGKTCNSCELEMTDMLTVTINALPTVDAGTDFDVCDAPNNVTLTGAGTANTYAWDNGVTDAVAFTGTMGVTQYIVTGTITATGCQNTDTVDVTVDPLPTVTAPGDITMCAGDTVLTGSGTANTYAWDNGVTDGVFFTPPVTTTTYTVTGTITATGCQNTDQVDITVNPLPTVNAGVDIVLCDDGTDTLLTGSGTADTYTWDNGIIDATLFSPNSGTTTYTVTGTITATGCQNTDMADVTVNPLPTVTAGLDQTECANLTVTLTGSGTANTYAWDGGVTDATPFNPALGSTQYIVTGTITATGCENTDTVDVTGFDFPVVTADSVWNASCMDTLDGQVFITVTGGAPGYLYDWDYDGTGDNDDLEDQDGLGDGTYNVTVEDANGCLGTSSSIITDPAALVASIAGFTDPTACATPDGTIDAAVAGGTGPYTYDWDNDGTGDNDDTEDLAALLAGNYILVVVDDNGCLSTVSQSLSDPSGPVVTIDGFVNNPCFGDSLASIDAGITGGLAPYTIDWDNDGTGDNDDTEDLSLLGSGTYVIVVTDVNGCIGTNTQDIIDPAAVAVAPLFTDALCNGDSTGTAVLNATGGTGTLIEDWGTSNPTMLEAGWHFYTVTDDNGCVLADSTEIMEPTVLTAAQTVTDISCYGLTDGSIDVTPAGGTGPYDVVFEGTDTTTTYSNLSDGTYGYTVTDANGCSLDSSASIVEPAPLIVSMTVTHEQAGGDGAIDLTVNGGTPVITFDWDNDGTGDFDDTEDLSGLTDGTYIVVVQDGNGCTATETAEIKPAQLGLGDNEGLNFSIYPNPTNGIITITFEELSNNSMISITDLAGKIVYTNTITETTEQVDLSGFERGTYVVTVQSANESHVKRIVKM